VFTSDGKATNTELIYKKFNNQSCPLLKGKPKFFIIQVTVLTYTRRSEAGF
jgi:hypothetical protein